MTESRRGHNESARHMSMSKNQYPETAGGQKSSTSPTPGVSPAPPPAQVVPPLLASAFEDRCNAYPGVMWGTGLVRHACIKRLLALRSDAAEAPSASPNSSSTSSAYMWTSFERRRQRPTSTTCCR